MSSPQSPFRIAVLLCDTPIPPVLATHGDYGAIFRSLFRKSLESYKAAAAAHADPSVSDLDFVVDAFDVRNKLEYPEDPDVYDAVLLTGSGACFFVDRTYGADVQR